MPTSPKNTTVKSKPNNTPKKLNMSAMHKIANKLITLQKPGERFTKGDLPVLNVAHIERAVKERMRKA